MLTTKRKRSGTRHTTADLFARIVDVVLLAHNREFPTRQCLSRRWRMSPRAVSYVIEHARTVYGVYLYSDPKYARGYALEDPGVLNVAALERWRR